MTPFRILASLVLLNGIIFILPLIYAAWISFHDRDVILRTQEFIGFNHYRRILTSSEAIAAMLLSLKFTAVVAVASLPIGLGIALVLNEDFPGRRFLRAAVLLPWAMSEVVTATAWIFIVNPTFGALTGVPILVNTSFNENEPIVNTPGQAIDCFQRTNMDGLAIGSFLVLKSVDTKQRESAQVPVGVTAD